MRAVIVARTYMGVNVCVGAMEEKSGTMLRPIPRDGAEVRGWTSFEPGIGELVEIEGARAPKIDPPHVEDFLVDRLHRLRMRVSNLAEWVAQRCEIWEGDPSRLFEGRLRSTDSGSRFIEKGEPLPYNSVGFWRLPWPLQHREFLDIGRVRHSFHSDGAQSFRLSYVGMESPPAMLERGTIVRLSLSRWWKRSARDASRCWMQLSGWI